MNSYQWIRESRKSACLSQSELGAKVGVSQVQVSQWENGKAVPSPAQEKSLRKALRADSAPSSTDTRKKCLPAGPPAKPDVSKKTTSVVTEDLPPKARTIIAKSVTDFAAVEDQLWEAADNLRANSKLTSSEYCMPVLGVIFLRHATNRYRGRLARRSRPTRRPARCPSAVLVKADFIKRRALMLPEKARYDASCSASPKAPTSARRWSRR